MAVPVYSEETFFYEVLLRFGEVAPNKGKLTGASLTQLTQLLRDGVLLNSTINPPEQLALVDGESGIKLGDVLGEVNANTIIDNQVLSAANQSLSAEVAAATTANQDLGTELGLTREELTAAQAEIQRLTDLLNQSVAVAEPAQAETPPSE